MPNVRNITSPVTLLGLGRSGTTLISSAFANHPLFQTLDESGGIIFSVWEGARDTFMPLPEEKWDIEKDPDAKSAYYVQTTLIGLCPSKKPRWFQKPAGFPVNSLNLERLPGERTKVTSFPVEWYWNVIQKSFPNARFITVLRNPFDVAISRRQHTNWNLKDVVELSVQFCEVLEYNKSAFSSIIDFRQLAGSFEQTMRNLAVAADFPFDKSMLEVKQYSHAPVAGRGPKSDHKEKWDEFKGMEFRKDYIEIFERVWDAVGFELDIPNCIKISK